MSSKVVALFFKVFTLPFWYLQRLFPRNKKLWLFGAWDGEGYADNSRAAYEDVLENEPELRPVWVTRSEAVYQRLKEEDKPVVKTNSLKGILLNLRAGVVFINNHPKDLNARTINGATQVWVWHGLMMKQIGRDARAFTYKRKDWKGKLKIKLFNLIFPEYIYKPDYAINTAPFFTPFFCSAFDLEPKEVLISGYPRNDAIFDDASEPIVKEIDEKFGTPLKILYMPTWRDALRDSGKNFNPFDDFGFSLPDFLDVLEEKNAVFLNKGHNFEKGHELFQQKADRFMNLQNNQITNLYTLLTEVDVLITDYSSVYFDFLLTGKSVILAPFDLEEYTTKSRPLYYDYFKGIEGVKALNWPEVLEIIKEQKYAPVSEETLEKFHQYKDGNSARRLTELLKKEFHFN